MIRDQNVLESIVQSFATPTSPTPTRTFSLPNTAFLLVVLGSVLSFLLYTLFVDFTQGGNSWKQGDWLINELSEPIRRGLFGSALLLFSDTFGLDPLAALIGLQAACLTFICVVIAAAAVKLGTPDKLLLLLLSPGFLFFFWFNDPQGSVRKELLVYLAFMPLILSVLTNRGALIACVLAIVAWGSAVLAHEGTVFFLPFLWIGLLLTLPSSSSLTTRLVVLAVPTLLAIIGGLYAALNTHVSDPAGICTQVITRGLDPEICTGAIDYVRSTPEQGIMGFDHFPTHWFRVFLLLYLLSLLSFRTLLQGIDHLEAWLLAIGASALAIFPLYILAGDYGRWLNYHVTALVLVALIALLKWRPSWLYQSPGRVDYYVLLGFYLTVGITHSPGEMTYGYLLVIMKSTFF